MKCQTDTWLCAAQILWKRFAPNLLWPGPIGFRIRRRYRMPCQKRQCCFLLIHSWMALDRAACFFFFFFLPSSSSFSSSPSFSSVPPVLYHTVRELCLWKKRYRRRIYKSWRDGGVSPGSQPTNQIVTLSLYDFVLFYPFKWVHVNWMSSNFFAVVLGHATLQWVLCISYVFFSSIPTKETETKIYYIEYIHIWLENGIQEWAFTFMAMLNEILIL